MTRLFKQVGPNSRVRLPRDEPKFGRQGLPSHGWHRLGTRQGNEEARRPALSERAAESLGCAYRYRLAAGLVATAILPQVTCFGGCCVREEGVSSRKTQESVSQMQILLASSADVHARERAPITPQGHTSRRSPCDRDGRVMSVTIPV